MKCGCLGVAVLGSSPLTRGKLAHDRHVCSTPGLIPAHAGKTPARQERLALARAHPRSRGENIIPGSYLMRPPGSSPLTRGKRSFVAWCGRAGGLIPAHAGKTTGAARRTASNRAHPRSRGENCMYSQSTCAPAGSSPLTRGKRSRGQSALAILGLIPAHAGKTRTWTGCASVSPAHPRSRGENIAAIDNDSWRGGSSPLTRGKR